MNEVNIRRKRIECRPHAAKWNKPQDIDLTVTGVVSGTNGSRRTFTRLNRNTMREKLWENERRCLRSKQSSNHDSRHWSLQIKYWYTDAKHTVPFFPHSPIVLGGFRDDSQCLVSSPICTISRNFYKFVKFWTVHLSNSQNHRLLTL